MGVGNPARTVVFLATLVLVLTSCERGRQRVPVSGRVTYEGHPIKRGAIRFLPDKQTEAPMSGAVIIEGQYTVAQGGVPVGTHRIEIEAYEGGSEDGDVNVPAARQYLPPRYNRESDLSLTVALGSNPITKNFELSKSGPAERLKKTGNQR